MQRLNKSCYYFLRDLPLGAFLVLSSLVQFGLDSSGLTFPCLVWSCMCIHSARLVFNCILGENSHLFVSNVLCAV